MAIVPFILIGTAIYFSAQRNHIAKSTFCDLATQNIEALAEDTFKHPCPSPYDVWEAAAVYDPKGGTFKVVVDGEIQIAGKKYKLAEARAGFEMHFTYALGRCDKGYPRTCCDNKVIGSVININPK